VASCTPRTHEPLFQSTIREAGLNPYLFEMTNIRDQCSWVHMHAPEEATRKAKDLVRMAVAKSNLLQPLYSSSVDVTQSGLVIGGGIAGMTAALGLANEGFPVYLVEKEDALGGLVRKLHYTLTGEDPQKCVDILAQKLHDHPLVTLYTGTEIEEVKGYIGNFTTTLSTGEELTHGIVIVATGGKEHIPETYLYGEDDRVVTQLELEQMVAEGATEHANTIAFINCVESRDEPREYCSRICCSEAVKNALKLKEQNPDTNIYVLYRDMRTYAFREKYYDEARERGVVFMRYDTETKPRLEKKEKNVKKPGKKKGKKNDILQLYVHDSVLNLDFSQMLKVPLDKDGFFLEAHMKLRPVDFATDGIFMAGVAHSPKFIDETISQAYGAVARACTVLSKDTMEAESIIAEVDKDLCSGCGICVPLCPYNARELDKEENIAKVNEVLCKGCGACIAACPSGASQQRHFRDSQLRSMIEAFV